MWVSKLMFVETKIITDLGGPKERSPFHYQARMTRVSARDRVGGRLIACD
jgi:hypothetical protein